MKITDYIKGRVMYDERTNKIVNSENMPLAEVNPMYEMECPPGKDTEIYFEISQFIADAINEKLERQKTKLKDIQIDSTTGTIRISQMK